MSELRLRPLAEQDLVERTQYYRTEGGPTLGKRFFDAAAETLDVVRDRPEGGSLRIGDLCEIEGLRTRRVAGFPCGWFYFIQSDYVDVVRLLSYTQDLPSELADLT